MPNKTKFTDQGGGDLEVRMARAIALSLYGEPNSANFLDYSAANAVILLGTNCPDLSAPLLQNIATELENHDACLIPAVDVGYSLSALKRMHASLFNNIA